MKKPNAVMISLKALMGILIAFMVAVPRIVDTQFILGGMNSWLLYTAMFICFVIIFYVLFGSLKIDHGPIINFCKFIGVSIFEGLMLAQGVLVSAYWLNYFTEGAVSAQMVMQVFSFAIIVTFVAVLGGLVITPIIMRREGAIRISDNIVKIFGIVILAYGILYLASWFAALLSSVFGAGGFFTDFFIATANIFYGAGPMSVMLSFLAVFGAEVLFIFTIIGVKKTITENNSKHIEWLCAAMIELAVLKIFIEIFRLLLKLRANGE